MKVVAALVLAVTLLALAGHSRDTALIAQTNPAGDWSCDVDGVAVDWTTSYRSGPGYAVTIASLSDLSPSCGGAEARVELYGDTAAATLVATGVTTIPSSGPSSVSVDLLPVNAQAERVNLVRVVLAGGAPPVPGACAAMRFDRVLVDQERTDVVLGSPRRDLVFGLGGGDRIDGGPNADCVSGGTGDDVIEGGTGRDVLLGNAGNDVLRDSTAQEGVEPGRDLLDGGEGDDQLEGGTGDDRLIGGPGTDRFDGGKGKDTCVAERGEDVRNCEVVIR